MKNLFLLVIALTLAASSLTACKSNSGSREFIPGKGWVPVK
jgi:hypothetical protein